MYHKLREEIRAGEGPRVSAAEILKALGARAYGLGIMVIMAPVCLPMPPGVPTIAGVILTLFAVQMLLGFKTPWLPGVLMRQTIERQKLLDGIDALERRLHFIERIAHPRLEFLASGIAARVYSLVFLVLGLILILPIPFLGNLPPAVAAAILALALAQRDGLLALGGVLASVAAVIFTWNLAEATTKWLASFFN